MPMTSPDLPLASPRVHNAPLEGDASLGRGARILAAVFGSLMFVVGAAGVMMALWAFAEGRWDEAREHATFLSPLLLGLLLLSSARSGRNLGLEGVNAMARGARVFR